MHKPVYRGYVLPPPSEFEEGDLFVHIPAQTIYLREGGVWVAVGTAAAVTDGQNVGGGEGEVYRDKTGSTLNFRTLTNGDGRLAITTSGDVVTIDFDPATADTIDEAVQDGVNLGAGARVFSDKQGTNLRFRTLKSSDGSVAVAEDGDEVDLTVDMSAAGAVTDAQNVGGGAGEIYRDKTGSTLNFRTLEVGDGALDLMTAGNNVILFGAEGDNVGGYAEVFKERNGTYLNFRTLRGTGGVNVFQHTDDVEIHGASMRRRNTYSYSPAYGYDTSSGRWWIHGNGSGQSFSWSQTLGSGRSGSLITAFFEWDGSNVEVDIIRLGILAGGDVYWIVGHGGDTASGLWGVEHSKRIYVSTFIPYGDDGILSGTHTYVFTGAGNAVNANAARMRCYCAQYDVF